MTVAIDTPDQLQSLVGKSLRASLTIQISSSLIDAFCNISGDRQWIHVKNDGRAIAPGNLLITLLPQLIQSALSVRQYQKCVTGKYQRVKFLQPVYVNGSIGLDLELQRVKSRAGKTYVEMRCQLTNSNATVVEATVTDVYYHAP